VYEAAVYAQDEWQVTPKLYLTYGLRYDVSRFPTTPAADPALASSVLQIDNTIQPSDHNNLAPRVGFTYDPEADGRQVIRGGSGLFFGRAPYVLYGNTLSNTGRTQLALNCLGAQAPQPDFPAHDGDPSTIPTTCLGGGAAAASKASPVVFSSDFQQTHRGQLAPHAGRRLHAHDPRLRGARRQPRCHAQLHHRSRYPRLPACREHPDHRVQRGPHQHRLQPARSGLPQRLRAELGRRSDVGTGNRAGARGYPLGLPPKRATPSIARAITARRPAASRAATCSTAVAPSATPSTCPGSTHRPAMRAPTASSSPPPSPCPTA
jgi:hypothetical protein